INVWLSKVDIEMMNSLALELDKSVNGINTNPENRMKIIEIHPAQMILLALQVSWCQQTEAAFGSPEMMEKSLQYIIGFLAELAESLLLDHPKQLRQKFEQIITDFVHQRDVTRQLIKLNIQNKNDFGWQYHMRFNWNVKEQDVGKQLLIQMGNANFHYGFEYLGVAEKLVQTPLTDKCFLTQTQALHLRMGGSPFGPAGTGKTESVKALGAQLGRFVLVFNCDETFDFNAMGRIFVGLFQVGAWGCFDEFNRLEERMLSACSQQILIIQTGLREKLKQIELMGKDVKLNSQMGVFVTMNPGYAGRSNLPENLKQLFRQMAMVKLDIELIAQVMLYSQGFQTAERLAGKILSSQPDYDFRLRALKSVLNSAGNMKRQEMIDRKQIPVPEEEIVGFEQMILLRSVCDIVVHKLIKEDIKLLETLLQSVFPGSYIPEIKEEKLKDELRKSRAQKNILPSKTFIQGYNMDLYLLDYVAVVKVQNGRYYQMRCLNVIHVIDPKALIKEGLLDRLELTDFNPKLRKKISKQRGESTKRHCLISQVPIWTKQLKLSKQHTIQKNFKIKFKNKFQNVKQYFIIQQQI
ncbi:Dynein heavy chain, partial [Paramecium bursaria]